MLDFIKRIFKITFEIQLEIPSDKLEKPTDDNSQKSDKPELLQRTKLRQDLYKETYKNPAKPAKINLIITKKMRQDLADLGWYKSEIDKLTPEEANYAIRYNKGPLR